MVSPANTPIAADVVICMWGPGHGAGVVSRQMCASVSCWQSDAKPRKRHLGNMSFSNHKSLKLHTRVCSDVPRREEKGQGRREENSQLGVCFSVDLSNISTQDRVRDTR